MVLISMILNYKKYQYNYIQEMADSGLYNPDFLKDLEEAENNIKKKKVRKIDSLVDLRNRSKNKGNSYF